VQIVPSCEQPPQADRLDQPRQPRRRSQGVAVFIASQAGLAGKTAGNDQQTGGSARGRQCVIAG